MNPPVVDLTRLTRRPDLEESVDSSPTAIGIYVLVFAGLALLGWSLVGGFTPRLFTAGAVLMVLGVIASAFYTRFVKFDCPVCGRRMSTRLADTQPDDLDPLLRWGFRCFHADGRCYSRPRNEEDDWRADGTREWVRLMRRVAVCDTCGLYAVVTKFEEMGLSLEEQLEYDSRYALSPDVVARLQEDAAQDTAPITSSG